MNTIAYKTARDTKIEVTIMRNQKLGVNGWLPSAQSEIAIKVNGETQMFCGIDMDKTNGFCIALTGKRIVPVPAEHQSTIAAWRDECWASINANISADNAAADQVLKIERVSNGDQAA
jgi:hypothetical protein